jgi:hypothetical protein
VWSLTSVQAPMLRQHCLRREGRATFTDERTFTSVQPQVLRQLALLAKRPFTLVTCKWTDAKVALFMLYQLHLLHECFAARRACKWALTRVKFAVHAQRQSR